MRYQVVYKFKTESKPVSIDRLDLVHWHVPGHPEHNNLYPPIVNNLDILSNDWDNVREYYVICETDSMFNVVLMWSKTDYPRRDTIHNKTQHQIKKEI